MADTQVNAYCLEEHPKILGHLKDHLHNFDSANLKNVQLLHKTVLPSAEGPSC